MPLIPNTIITPQNTTIRKNSGADIGTRKRLNLIEGANVTFTIVDDPASDEVDITITTTGGGGAGSKLSTYVFCK